MELTRSQVECGDAPKTVETHLRQTYRKLDIGGRDELARVPRRD